LPRLISILMLTIPTILTFMALLSLFLVLNNIIFAYGAYWFFYKFLGPTISHRQILETKPTLAQINKEKRRTFLTLFIFLLMGTGLYICYRLDITKTYYVWDQRGKWYFFLSFFLMHQFHDLYFYATHRLMHEWKPLRRFHFAHHESSPPSPFAALSFHPVEAFIQGLFWYITAFLIPMPAFWLFGFYTFMSYINMWGHNAYEFWHKDLFTHPFLWILNTPTHHNLHHKYHKFNYGIYYNIWDKICGTNHPEYENHYRAVKMKSEISKTSRIFKAMKL